eukprot:2035416-Rhodomonas_salina.1
MPRRRRSSPRRTPGQPRRRRPPARDPLFWIRQGLGRARAGCVKRYNQLFFQDPIWRETLDLNHPDLQRLAEVVMKFLRLYRNLHPDFVLSNCLDVESDLEE